jgi:hypothetical protein
MQTAVSVYKLLKCLKDYIPPFLDPINIRELCDFVTYHRVTNLEVHFQPRSRLAGLHKYTTQPLMRLKVQLQSSQLI